MKCARFQLQQRARAGRGHAGSEAGAGGVGGRYCQRRLVDPGLDEDPRLQRYRCNIDYPEIDINDPAEGQDSADDQFLTVQTLKFQGDERSERQPRACFKYTTGPARHRLFVKQPVPAAAADERASALTCYLDDYLTYVLNSRPPSEKSDHYISADFDTNKINKSIQFNSKNVENTVQNKHESKTKKSTNGTQSTKGDKTSGQETKNQAIDSVMQDAKVAYHKSGKRKSITISRAQSPETVQVIRVDVVCNYSSTNSVISEEDDRRERDVQKTVEKEIDSKTAVRDLRNSQFANRYFLTKSIKSLDESVAGGAKVTLLCKTFKLSDRSKTQNQDAIPKRNDKFQIMNYKNC